MLRINFDVTSLQSNRLTGIGNYIKNLINTFQQENLIKASGTFKYYKLKKYPYIRKKVDIPVSPLFAGFENIQGRNWDVFHGPDFKLPQNGNFKKIATVHDMAVFNKELFNAEFVRRVTPKFHHLIKACKPDHIITVSEFSKAEFLKYYPEYQNNVSVVYNGINHLKNDPQDKTPLFDFPYLLYLGTIEKRKNIEKLIEAFNQANKKYSELHLVLVGKKGFASENVFSKIRESSCKGKIHYMGYVADHNKISLIRNAEALIYPSVYEGFGLPVLEAMSIGTPVITSNTGATQEIAGDAAYLASPMREDDIAHGIKTIISDSIYRKNLIRKGINNAAGFTWKKCAEDTLKVYEHVAGQK